QGDTSEVSDVRQGGAFVLPSQSPRLTAGQPMTFSAASGLPVSLRDPSAGPLDAEWELTLSVSTGTLTLSNIDGLVGSGNSTGSLAYRGALSVLDSALSGMQYTPPSGFHGNAIMSLAAQSEGAAPLQSKLVITDGLFVVTTDADSGPGSLREAILDSNAS